MIGLLLASLGVFIGHQRLCSGKVTAIYSWDKAATIARDPTSLYPPTHDAEHPTEAEGASTKECTSIDGVGHSRR